MTIKRNLAFFSAIFLVVIYLVFALLAFVNFPGRYSPLENWLSDLGSGRLNPGGALFYNLGISLCGIGLLVFFSRLGEWKLAGNKVQNIMLLLTQVFGCLGAAAMILSAVFPISIAGIHSFLSAALYILLGTAFGFSVAALRYYPAYPKGLLVLGGLVALEDMLWGMLLNTYLMEWITVALFLLYIVVLGSVTRRKGLLTIEPASGKG